MQNKTLRLFQNYYTSHITTSEIISQLSQNNFIIHVTTALANRFFIIDRPKINEQSTIIPE